LLSHLDDFDIAGFEQILLHAFCWRWHGLAELGLGTRLSSENSSGKEKKLSVGGLNHWKRRGDQLMLAVGDAIFRNRAVQQEYEKKSYCRSIEVASWRKTKNLNIFLFLTFFF